MDPNERFAIDFLDKFAQTVGCHKFTLYSDHTDGFNCLLLNGSGFGGHYLFDDNVYNLLVVDSYVEALECILEVLKKGTLAFDFDLENHPLFLDPKDPKLSQVLLEANIAGFGLGK